MHEHYKLLVSAVIDGEATDDERAELAKHIAECPECAALLEAYSAVGAELADGVEPPAKLAEGIMYRVKNEKKKRRFAFGRFTAIAAAAIVIVVAGRFALSGLFRAGSAEPKDAAAPQAVGDVEDMDGVNRGPLTSNIPLAPSAADPDTYGDVSAEPSEPGSSYLVTADPRAGELMILVLDHPDVAAIYAVSGDVEIDTEGSVANAISGGEWYELPAEEGEALADKADNVIYLQDGAETCIIVVYYD